MAVFNSYGDRVDMMKDLVYRPEADRSRMETLPYYPSLDIARAQPLPYRPQEQEAETLIGQGADFLNTYIKGLFSSPSEVAGGIPVGEDPDLPMSQEQFNDYVRGRIEGRGGTKMRRALEPYGGTIIPIMRQHFKGASRGISDADFARVLNDSSLNQSQSQDLALSLSQAFQKIGKGRGVADAGGGIAESLESLRSRVTSDRARPKGNTFGVLTIPLNNATYQGRVDTFQ